METPAPTQAPKKSTSKFVFVLKLIVCIISFGFIFPNIMNE